MSQSEYSHRKRVPKRENFLQQMNQIIPWKRWVAMISPFYPEGKRGRPPKGIECMLRMYLMQAWFNLSDEGIEDAIYDSYSMKKFLGIDFRKQQVPDATTLLKFRHLLVSPVNARTKLYSLIDNEISNANQGLAARITVKINNLVDEGIISKLYQASQAGVQIYMLVRGMCSLIPNVKNLSTNIHIRSIVDRYLEHPRVMIFHNNGDEKIYISSADWMTRNLDHRIEVGTPIFSKHLKKIIKDIIDIQFNDNVKARIIDEKQTNQYVPRPATQRAIRSQMEIYDYLETLEENKREKKKK